MLEKDARTKWCYIRAQQDVQATQFKDSVGPYDPDEPHPDNCIGNECMSWEPEIDAGLSWTQAQYTDPNKRTKIQGQINAHAKLHGNCTAVAGIRLGGGARG